MHNLQTNLKVFLKSYKINLLFIYMNVLKAIRTKREVRNYLHKEVPLENILKILEAGRLAQSSKNTQPWHFIVIRNKEKLKKISETTPTGKHIANASFAIALFMENAKLPEIDGTRAMQNMMLAAWELGIGSCWVANFNEKEVKKILKVPESLKLITVVPFGYPADKPKGKKIRKSLEEITHWEYFGSKLIHF